MKKTIIFDLDGTLINSLKDLAVATNYSLGCMGLPPHPVETYKTFVGNGVMKLIERALPLEQRTPKEIHSTKNLFDTYYSQHGIDYTKPYPEISELLGAIKEMGLQIAVVTNKPHEYAVTLVRSLLGEHVDYVMGQQENIPPKPDPKGVQEVLRYFACDTKECLYVGDSNVDIVTAQNAGVESVGVLWGFREQSELEEARADHIIKNPLALLDILV
ncbi:MAG: HAD family hydrolase [Cellulosilyticaceae bacterium]